MQFKSFIGLAIGQSCSKKQRKEKMKEGKNKTKQNKQQQKKQPQKNSNLIAYVGHFLI